MPMRITRTLLVAALASLGAASSARGEFTPIAGFDEQLFPSYLIATAGVRPDASAIDPQRLGDPTGILGVELVSPGANTPIQVTLECDAYLQTSVFSGALAEAGASYRITPKVKYHFDRLAQCQQSAPVNVTFRVRLGGQAEEERTVTCTMRSINDCPFAFQDGQEIVDASFAFAAYVNEQHPFVDKLLREALDRGVVKSFDGYQSGQPESVILQAYAIWDLLVARDIRYSSITTTAAKSQTVACQHVRLIEDSINNSQANCVDGSVLWVSLLRKIGIDGFLVITPNHCYAGFYLDPQREVPLAIETTLLGAELDPEQVEVSELYDQAIPVEMRYDDTFTSFVAALETGTAALEAAIEADGKDAAEVIQIIDMAAMRQQGVLPIAFQNKQEFVSYDFTSDEWEEDADDESSDEEDRQAWDEEEEEDSDEWEEDDDEVQYVR